MQVKKYQKKEVHHEGEQEVTSGFFCSLTKYFILSANSLLAWGLVLVSTSTSTSTSRGTKYSSKKADDTSRYPSRPCLMLFDHVHLWTNPKHKNKVIHLWTNPKPKNKIIHLWTNPKLKSEYHASTARCRQSTLPLGQKSASGTTIPFLPPNCLPQNFFAI